MQTLFKSENKTFNLYIQVMGTIIGKGGSRINEIRKLSGANIRIARKEDDKAADAGSSGGGGDVNMDVNDDNNTAASSSTSSPG